MDEKQAAQILGRKGGRSTSSPKVQAARNNGRKGGRPSKGDWAVVVVYDCGLGTSGEIISWHSRYDLARLKAKRTGYDDFLRIAHCNDLET